jgi:NitT/TauT family transport system substrate-binding protein
MALMGGVLLVGGAGGCSKERVGAGEAKAGGGAASGAVVADGGGAAKKLIPVRFRTDWYPQAEHGGFYEALAKGYYREAGLEVQILPGGPGPTLAQLMMAGTADLAMGRSDDVMVYVNSGLPLLIVGAYMERDPQGILLHEQDPAKGFPDLNGRAIMANQGANWIDYVKARYKIDFQLIPMNFGIAQFMADPRFIQQCFVTSEPYFVQKNGGHPRTLLIADSGYNPYRVIFGMKGFVREHPEAVRAFVAASIRGWREFMAGDAEPAKRLILQSNPQMTSDFIAFSMGRMRDDLIIEGRAEKGERLGLMTRARMREQSALLAQLKIIPAALPLERFVRFDLLPEDLAGAVGP